MAQAGINVGVNNDYGVGVYSHGILIRGCRPSRHNRRRFRGLEGSVFGQSGASTYGLNVQAAYGDYVMGIYSTASSGNYETWAGVFLDGDTYTGGCFRPSDIMFKKNGVQLSAGGLNKSWRSISLA